MSQSSTNEQTPIYERPVELLQRLIRFDTTNPPGNEREPVEGQSWQHPPFEGKNVDGWIWGRGALDMKGGVAMMLAAFLRAKAEGLTPPGDVLFLALSDE